MGINIMFKMFHCRLNLQNSKLVIPVRFYCEPQKYVTQRKIQKVEEERSVAVKTPSQFEVIQVKYWNEVSQIKRHKIANSGLRKIKNYTDLIKMFQNLKRFPLTLTEFYYYLKRRHVRNQLLEQSYLPERVEVLKPDLAAAHFLIRRGGSVRFYGQTHWISFKDKSINIPLNYIPGFFVEGIKAEGTELYFEGLKNLEKLKHLKYLSLKNLDTVDDWFLDWISNEYFLNLRHLDISGCKNVTYRGLSCFYRFERLHTLEVMGVPDTPEFKLACLMLLDIMPHLDIRGIDLNIPEKIEPVNSVETEQTLIP